MDEPSTWRLAGFGIVVCGAGVAAGGTVAGGPPLAVEAGVRAMGLGLVTMGASTLYYSRRFADRPPAGWPPLVRGGVLVVVGGWLLVGGPAAVSGGW